MKGFTLLAVLLAWGLALPAFAQDEGKLPWEEYDKLINKRSSLASMGPDLFGDAVDLYTGSLSFSATDVSIPGNSGLAVAVGRSYTVTDRKGYWLRDLPFAD